MCHIRFVIFLLFLFLIPGCPDLNKNKSNPSKLLTSLMDVWESGETNEIHEIFHNDATYDDYPNNTQYKGLNEISGYIKHVHSWASNVVIHINSIHSGDSSAIAEWEMSMIQNRPIGNRVPVATGKSIKLNGVTIIEMSSDKIMRAADYIDVASFVLQLGGKVELPGGNVLRLQ